MKESDQRFTPQDVLDVVREFAPIMLDPCTTEANPVGAALHFTAQDDGLGTEWLEVINGNGPLDGVAFGERQGRFSRVFSPHAYVQVLR